MATIYDKRKRNSSRIKSTLTGLNSLHYLTKEIEMSKLMARPETIIKALEVAKGDQYQVILKVYSAVTAEKKSQ
jgi:hypothetical protein